MANKNIVKVGGSDIDQISLKMLIVSFTIVILSMVALMVVLEKEMIKTP